MKIRNSSREAWSYSLEEGRGQKGHPQEDIALENLFPHIHFHFKQIFMQGEESSLALKLLKASQLARLATNRPIL